MQVLHVLVRGQRCTSGSVLQLGGSIVGDANVSPGTIVLTLLSASSLQNCFGSLLKSCIIVIINEKKSEKYEAHLPAKGQFIYSPIF